MNKPASMIDKKFDLKLSGFLPTFRKAQEEFSTILEKKVSDFSIFWMIR
jgi:hypothetical protein